MKRQSLLVRLDVLGPIAKNRGLGPVKLARWCGHENHSYMSRLLRGEPQARRVTYQTAERLADLFGCPLDVLFVVDEVESADSTTALPRPRRAA